MLKKFRPASRTYSNYTSILPILEPPLTISVHCHLNYLFKLNGRLKVLKYGRNTIENLQIHGVEITYRSLTQTSVFKIVKYLLLQLHQPE